MKGLLMEATTMGRVLTEATIENLEDLWAVKRGLLAPELIRRRRSRMPSSTSLRTLDSRCPMWRLM